MKSLRNSLSDDAKKQLEHPAIRAIAKSDIGSGLDDDAERLEQYLRLSDLVRDGRKDKDKTETHSDDLTQREREIAGYLAQGFEKIEIAETLIVASSTIQKHCQNISRKWKVSEHTGELHREALRRGYGVRH